MSFVLLFEGCSSPTSPSGTQPNSSVELVDSISTVSIKKTNGQNVTSSTTVNVDDSLEVEVRFSLSSSSWSSSNSTFYVNSCIGITEDTFLPLWCGIVHPSVQSSNSIILRPNIRAYSGMPNKAYFVKNFLTEDGIGKGGGFPPAPFGVPVSMIPVKIFASETVQLEISIVSP